MSYFIITIDPIRLGIWEHIFETDTLPALSDQPRWQWVDGHQQICAYDLHLTILSQIQRNRLAGYISRRIKRPFVEVQLELNTSISWPLKARDCVAVEEDTETAETRPSFILPVARYGQLAMVG